ncbi:MAG TPA: aminoglycoside phosphotransferase family protein [Actinocrinis sp.]|nr:aminoglycoside phosphotransferase family protein [Actinocrinis sp.]
MGHSSLRMHDDQLTVTSETVRELIRDQFPAWRDLQVRAVASQGTVNAIFRIGDDLAARFPLRPGDVAATRRSLRNEALAARELADHTRFATPEPVALGEPGRGYPLPWSVQTWIAGDIAGPSSVADSIAFAHDLAEFISEVRAIDTRGRAFSGHGRGGDLKSHDAWMETCFEKSEGLLDVPRLRRMWAELRQLPRGSAANVMTHGDLIPGNVLVARGRLAGVLDAGGFGPADPALDLVGAWHLLDPAAREQLRADLGCDDLEWRRGKAWAFEQAMGAAWYYRQSNPAMSELGQVTLGRLIKDEATAA